MIPTEHSALARDASSGVCSTGLTDDICPVELDRPAWYNDPGGFDHQGEF